MGRKKGTKQCKGAESWWELEEGKRPDDRKEGTWGVKGFGY